MRLFNKLKKKTVKNNSFNPFPFEKKKQRYKKIKMETILCFNGDEISFHFILKLLKVYLFCRYYSNSNLQRLWKSYSRPIHPKSSSQSGMACWLSQVRRLWSPVRWNLHMLRKKRENLLQKRLYTVRLVLYLKKRSLFCHN